MIEVLLLEDNLADAILFQMALEEIDPSIQFTLVQEIQGVNNKIGDWNNEPEQKFEMRLVVLDLVTNRESGFEVMEKLRVHPIRDQLVVVFFTAMENIQCIQKAYELGVNAYLFKPTKFEDNVVLLKRLLQFYNPSLPVDQV